MYTTLIFDLDNTLLNYDHCELDSMLRTCQTYGLFQDDPTAWEVFWVTYLSHNSRYWDEMSTGGGITTIFEVLYLSFRDTLNQNHQLHAGLSQTYWDNFCSTCHFEEGALSLLDEVKDHYKLGIISNGISDAQNKRLQTGGVKDWFQAIIVSDEAGFRKPNKSIFDLALKQMNAARDEVLFIGDSLIYDYEGAMNSGIDFCFYNRKKEEVPSEFNPKYIVHELRELNELLRRL